jgi:hypothetical protein
MASIKSQRFYAPKQMHVDGRAIFIDDKVVLSANPTAGDTLDFMIPAGLRVSQVDIQCDDLDSNGSPTFVFSVGYAPVKAGSALSPNATYFAPTGQSTAQTGGRLRCNFKPITFEEDVMLRVTVGTASATFQAGEVHAIVAGNCVGPK